MAKTCGLLPTQIQNHCIPNHEYDKLPYTNPKDRYHISSAQNHPLNIGEFLHEGNVLLLTSEITEFLQQPERSFTRLTSGQGL
jgi:hypothetical protein